MVTKNPIFAKWSIKRFQATVINDVWPEVAFFTLVATMVYLVTAKTSHSLAISNQMLTVLGIVLGLVVSFRTSSAYDRYWEARKLWTNINLVSRNLAHLIWIHVPNERENKAQTNDANDGTPKQSKLKAVIEKKSMINLVQAFSVAVKHALRGEAGIYYEDLYPLVCFLPRYASQPPEVNQEIDVLPLWEAPASPLNSHFPRTTSGTVPTNNGLGLGRVMSSPGDTKEKEEAAAHVRGEDRELGWAASLRLGQKRNSRTNTFDPEQVLPTVACDRRLRPARNPPRTTLYDYIPLLFIFKPIVNLIKRTYHLIRRDGQAYRRDDSRNSLGRKRKPAMCESSVPLEITLFLSSYLGWLLRNGLLQPAIASAYTNAIITLQDTMANLDRIRTTPIPFAYQAHLRMSMWLYLFFLPFQVVSAYEVLTIPATAFAAFLLLGFLEIGQEIEDPFNYDLNDLDLDHFCLVIQRELSEITAHPSPDPDTFLFGPWNQPFAPADRRNAKEMMENVDHEYHGPDTGMASIRRTLLRSWREVSDLTVQT